MNFVKTLSIFAAMNLGCFAAQHGLVARWDGSIHIPDREKELHVTLDLAQNAAGEWIGSISLPDVHIQDAPVMNLSVKDNAVHFTLGVSRASFEGTLDANEITGTATNDEGSAPFRLKKIGAPAVKVPAPSTVLSKELEGTWEGVIEVEGKRLRAVLELSRTPDGIGKGVLISVDEGGQKLPISTITQSDKSLKLELAAINSKYNGVVNSGASEISGEYAVGGLNVPLVFKRVAADAKMP